MPTGYTHYPLPKRDTHRILWNAVAPPAILVRTLQVLDADVIVCRVASGTVLPPLLAERSDARYVALLRGRSPGGQMLLGSFRVSLGALSRGMFVQRIKALWRTTKSGEIWNDSECVDNMIKSRSYRTESILNYFNRSQGSGPRAAQYRD